ncbi:MAG: dockerin type I domain-containing protein, partial [Phycisphaerae bacterium]
AAVIFSANGTNAAKNATATFTKAGNYSFQVTLTDAGGLTTTSSVNVTVNPTLTSIGVTPATATVVSGQTRQFTATGYDQFGTALTVQPTFTWSVVSGVGSVDASGLYTASYAAGSASVKATSGSINNTAAVTVTNAIPTVATAAAATPSPVTATTTSLSVLGADDAGEANLTYTWATTGTPPAAVIFSANGTNAAKNATATFIKAGNYSFQVTLTDAGGLTTTSSVNVTVNQIPTAITLNSNPASLDNGQSTTVSVSAVTDQFGNPILPLPTVIWSLQGAPVGTLTAGGVYTAPAAGAGTDIIQATLGTATTTTSITTILGVISGSGGNDTIRLVRHAPASGQLDVYINNVTGTPTYSASLATMGSLLLTEPAGNATFVLDYSNGAPLSAGPITLTGSSGGLNTLSVIGISTADSFGLTSGSLTHGTDPVLNFSHISTVNLGTGIYSVAGDLNGLNLTANAGTSITLNATNHLGTVTLASGATVQLAAGLNKVLVVGTMTLASGAVLDVADNSLICTTADLTTVRNWLKNGQIHSSLSLGNLPVTTLGYLGGGVYNSLNPAMPVDGYTVQSTDIVVRYTYSGDTNLDGKIDAVDFAQIDVAFLRGMTNAGWINGDVNYDGLVTAADFALINNAYPQQTTYPLAAAAVPAVAALATPSVAVALTSAVPTPNPTPSENNQNATNSAPTTTGATQVLAPASAPALSVSTTKPRQSSNRTTLLPSVNTNNALSPEPESEKLKNARRARGTTIVYQGHGLKGPLNS